MSSTRPATDTALIMATVNPDLQRSRETASFETEDLTDLLNGGKEITKKKRDTVNVLFSNPIFRTDNKYHMTPSERYEAGIQKAITLPDLAMKHGWMGDQDLLRHIGTVLRFDVGVLLHFAMFIPVLERLTTEEQQERWLSDAFSLRMIGTYAQTELGHGTYLRGLMTKATYDPDTQEFIINTPFPEGMKWWPGSLGKTTNHAVVMATLYVNGENCGMQGFLVQLRDIDTHQPLPGIELGEIGPRFGLVTADNGYLIMRDVRVQRTNMLMKYAEVTPQGKFIKRGSEKANYGTMMMVRANIVSTNYDYLSQACTIATRYSAVRHQSELKPGAPEPQIMEYQTQQYKLFPNLALAYAIYFSKKYMLDYYQHCYENEIQKGNYNSVPELHSQSACLKAYTSEEAVEGIEILRRSCGGHGYMLASGLCDLYCDALAGCTYEGENTVLYLQTARYLMKCFASARSGDMLAGSSAYMMHPPPPCTITSPADCRNPKHLTNLFYARSYHMISDMAKKLQKELEQGTPHYIAWNKNSVQLVTVAKAHVDSFVAINTLNSLQNMEMKPEIRRVLNLMSHLHCLHRVVRNSGQFLQTGVLNTEQMELIREQELELLSFVRPEAVSLVDAFDWHESVLNSTLGRYDGNVYENMYEAAKNSPMNKTTVHSAFDKHLKPFIERSKL